MKELIGTARNVCYRKNDDGKLEPNIEVILIVTEPVHSVDAAGCLVTSREAETVRFMTSVKGLRRLASSLGDYADEAEKE